MFFFVIFVLAIVELIQHSFWTYTSTMGEIRIYTLEQYIKYFSNPFYVESVVISLRVALAVTIIDIILAYPLAYSISRSRRRYLQSFAVFVVLTPMVMDPIVRNYGWLIILGDHGLVNQILLGLGLVSSPIPLLFTESAVIVSLSNELLPMMVLALSSVMQSISVSLEEQASILGANSVQRFFRIILPLSIPGILGGSLIVFGITASSFVAPLILGGGKVNMGAIIINRYFSNMVNWPFGSAVSIVFAVITLALIVIYSRVLGTRQLLYTAR